MPAPRTLQIDWTMRVPPLAAASWQSFADPGTPDPEDLRIARGLKWPDLSPKLLKRALEAGLPRDIGWSAKDRALTEAVRVAARHYRRGVACEGEEAEKVSGSYEIRFHPLEADPASLVRSPFTIADMSILDLWPSVRKDIHASHLADEKAKTLGSVASLLEGFEDGAPPAWNIVSGGLLGDMLGFAAAVTGGSFSFVPTTLLAMADACVGGKTGVNAPPYGKNQIGLFAFPTSVDIWPGWLKTLPKEELASGGAECLKHAFLAGDKDLAKKLAKALASSDLATIADCLPAVVKVKADVVAEDPVEAGRRATLNFGHTLGHAIEALSHAKAPKGEHLRHGECVAVGMAFALRLSEKVASLSPAASAEMQRLLANAKVLPQATRLRPALGGHTLTDPTLWQGISRLILKDKKTTKDAGRQSRWVLLADWGKAIPGDGRYTVPVPETTIKEVWDDFAQDLSDDGGLWQGRP